MNYKTNAYSIRSFIEELRKNHPEEIFEVDEKVKVGFETTAYFLNLRKRNPVVLFNNIDGYDGFTLVTNIFGSEERFARIAGFKSIGGAMDRLTTMAASVPTESIIVSRKQDSFQKTITGEEINLFDLPIPSHYEMDGSKKGLSRYITAGLTTTIDPESEDIVNLSFSRIQPFERNKFAFDAGSHGNLWRHLNVSRLRGERLGMTILVGTNPIFYILGASFIDNEFAKANKFFNISFEPGRLNSIPIPRDTEIAIEAEFQPDETFDEGPFAEYVGYMGYDSTKFVAEVKSILMKKDPVYYDIQPSNSSEHVNLFSIPRSSIVMKSVSQTLPKGLKFDIKWPHYGGRFISFAYLDNPNPGMAKQLGISILGLDPLWNKIVFVNEGMTRLNIETALTNLAQIKKYSENNVARILGVFVISSDPTRDELGRTGKIVFVTRAKPLRIEKLIREDRTIFKTREGTVLFSHDNLDDCKVGVVVSDDIDIRDEEQVGWAIATRLNPETDIEIRDDRITFLATRKVPPVAGIPKKVEEKIKRKF